MASSRSVCVRRSQNVTLRQVRTIDTGGSGILLTKDHRIAALGQNIKVLESEVAQSWGGTTSNVSVRGRGTIGILIDNPEATNIVVRNNVSCMNRFAAQIKMVAGRVVVERNVVTDPGFR